MSSPAKKKAKKGSPKPSPKAAAKASPKAAPKASPKAAGSKGYSEEQMRACIDMYATLKLSYIHAQIEAGKYKAPTGYYEGGIRVPGTLVEEWKEKIKTEVIGYDKAGFFDDAFFQQLTTNVARRLKNIPLTMKPHDLKAVSYKDDDPVAEFCESVMGKDLRPSKITEMVQDKVQIKATYEVDVKDCSKESVDAMMKGVTASIKSNKRVEAFPPELKLTGYSFSFDEEPLFDVKQSNIPDSGYGLFAARDFKVGDCLGIFFGVLQAAAPEGVGHNYCMKFERSLLQSQMKLPKTVLPGDSDKYLWAVPSPAGQTKAQPHYFGLHFANDPAYCMSESSFEVNAKVHDKDMMCFACEPIGRGEEVFFNYNAEDLNQEWVPSQDKYVGQSVKAWFSSMTKGKLEEAKVYHGKVNKVVVDKKQLMYEVEFEDGDKEFYTEEELKPVLDPHPGKYGVGDKVMVWSQEAGSKKPIQKKVSTVTGFQVQADKDGTKEVVDEEFMKDHELSEEHLESNLKN